MIGRIVNKRLVDYHNKLYSVEKELSFSIELLKNYLDHNIELNQDFSVQGEEVGNLPGLLYQLGLRLQDIHRREKEEQWETEGLNRFMDLLNEQYKDETMFYQSILSFLAKKLNLPLGALYLREDQQLHCTATYACSIDKMAERITPGEGMLGQAFADGKTQLISNLPEAYCSVASGLGASSPNYLLLVPLKLQQESVGILELASFKEFKPFEIDFVEKLAGHIASICFSNKHNHQVKRLLQQSMQNEQALKEKEETLRQQMEELLTTQEEMMHKEIALDAKSTQLQLMINHIPFPVFVKDETGRYQLVNISQIELMGVAESEIIGKTDEHFIENKEEWEVIRKSDREVLESGKTLELPIQYFTTPNGKKHVFKTTKVPFENKLTGQRNILGVSVDLTEKYQLERELLSQKKTEIHHTLINVAGRQRMLSQQIGFYAERVYRGQQSAKEKFKKAIDLHEDSLQVILNGGMPKGLGTSLRLPPAPPSLLIPIAQVQEIWTVARVKAEALLQVKPEETELLSLEEHLDELLIRNEALVLVCIQSAHIDQG